MTSTVNITIEQYKKLWMDWISLLEQQGTLNEKNKKELLLKPIEQNVFKSISKFEIPEEVIKLYSIYNIDPNRNEWTFSVDSDGCFDLLSFEGIDEAWESVNDLIVDTEEEIKNNQFTDFGQTIDEEIDGKNCYARREWIPIATDRQGDYLLIDLVPTPKGKKGQIIMLSNESWDRIIIADSLYDLLTDQLNYLKSNMRNA